MVDFAGVSRDELKIDLRSWGQWLGERGNVTVKSCDVGTELEFRKFRYKSRNDKFVFRYRNAGSTRGSFDIVRNRFDEAGVEYELELTKKRQSPRAIAVSLDPSDPMMCLEALRLIDLAFDCKNIDCSTFDVQFCGNVRSLDDAPSILLSRQGRDQAHELGRSLGNMLGGLYRMLVGKRK
jgi:hypothetical protein